VERPELRLVTADAPRQRTLAAGGLGGAVLLFAALATWRGADSARRSFDAATLAESALARTLATGDARPADEALSVLRARLTRTPLDSASRTILASLMAESATGDAVRAAAVEQVLAAARLAATDEVTARAAARVLARCGRSDLALRQIAGMFAYAPGDAAVALLDIEPLVPAGRIDDGLPATPAAWLAWSVRLREAGRENEADARLAELRLRWPGDLDALRIAASAAASRDRIDELTRLVPPSLVLPETPDTAHLLAYRARSKALAGDMAGAHADAQKAIALSEDAPWVLALAGDAFARNEPELALTYWTRSLYQLQAKPETRSGAIWLRYRLARLYEHQGRAGDAMRQWRAILEERPDDPEAQARIADLTGSGAR
jgi:tetratricopeptide (TPR) repeat protein